MRITNNTLTNNYLNSLNKMLARQSDIQEKMADQKDIHRASDDPAKVIRSLRFKSSLLANEQFVQNAKDAQSWLENTDGALSDLSSIMTSAKELTVKAISTNTADSFKAIGSQIDGLINQAVATANKQMGDRYLFAGQSDKTQPFTRSGDTFIYNGDNNKISMIIKPGSVNTDQDSINVTGKEVFGPALEMLNHLVEIKNQLNTGNPQLDWLSNTGLDYIEKDHDRVLQQQTKIGSRMSMYELAQNMLGDDNVLINEDLSNNDDLNIEKAIMDYKSSENAYNASLAIGAKIMPKSLLDFLT